MRNAPAYDSHTLATPIKRVCHQVRV